MLHKRNCLGDRLRRKLKGLLVKVVDKSKSWLIIKCNKQNVQWSAKRPNRNVNYVNGTWKSREKVNLTTWIVTKGRKCNSGFWLYKGIAKCVFQKIMEGWMDQEWSRTSLKAKHWMLNCHSNLQSTVWD